MLELVVNRVRVKVACRNTIIWYANLSRIEQDLLLESISNYPELNTIAVACSIYC